METQAGDVREMQERPCGPLCLCTRTSLLLKLLIIRSTEMIGLWVCVCVGVRTLGDALQAVSYSFLHTDGWRIISDKKKSALWIFNHSNVTHFRFCKVLWHFISAFAAFYLCSFGFDSEIRFRAEILTVDMMVKTVAYTCSLWNESYKWIHETNKWMNE